MSKRTTFKEKGFLVAHLTRTEKVRCMCFRTGARAFWWRWISLQINRVIFQSSLMIHNLDQTPKA